LKKLYKRFKNKYLKVEFIIEEIQGFSFYSKNLFPFFDSVEFCSNKYILKTKSKEEFFKEIIELFKVYGFNTKEYYNKLYFEFEYKNNYFELIDSFEKITDKILVILQNYKEKRPPFLNKLYQRFKSKYQYTILTEYYTCLCCRELFRFIGNTEVILTSNSYELKSIRTYEHPKLNEKIINTFENYNFKTTERNNILYFKFEHELNNQELVNYFEKITDEILEISQLYKEKRQFFLKKLHQQFKSKYSNAEITENDSTALYSKNLIPYFVRFVEIDFYTYKLKISNYYSKITKQIIKIFDVYKFKTHKKRSNEYIFEFQQKMESVELIAIFEKITDEIIEILQEYEKK